MPLFELFSSFQPSSFLSSAGFVQADATISGHVKVNDDTTDDTTAAPQAPAPQAPAPQAPAPQAPAPQPPPAPLTPQQTETKFLLGAMDTAPHADLGMGPVTMKENGQHGSPYDGSQAVAAMDMPRLTPALQQRFKTAEQQSGIPAAILAGISSRETGIGSPAVLAPNGMSRTHGNHGYGIMQVDQAAHPGTMDGVSSVAHIEDAAKILNATIKTVRETDPNWTPSEQLRAAIAAYNKGHPGSDPNHPDSGTTGGDYSSDALARANYYRGVFKE